MKKLLAALAVLLALISCKKDDNTLTIYSYNSLSWIKDQAVSDFENLYNCKVIVNTDFTDTGDMISKAILEKKSPKADLLIGLTPSLLIQAKEQNILQPYRSENIDKIKDSSLIFDEQYYTTPYDYGALAVIYNPEKISNLETFSDLWKNPSSLIIQDPRSSSTGLDFFLWTIALFGENWENEWKSLKSGILSVTSGWSESFSKFDAGEAPMMVSYATDPAYTYHNYNVIKNKAFIPSEGGYIQIEGASIVKGAKNKKLAEKFIDYMLTEDFQKHIPLNQWMFPVIDIELPQAFQYAVTPEKLLTVDNEILKSIPSLLERWEKLHY